MLDIIIIVTIFIFGFIFIHHFRTTEGFKSKKTKNNSAVKSSKSVSNPSSKSVKPKSKSAKPKAKRVKTKSKRVKSNSTIKLTNQLNQYKANLAASEKNERALTSAMNLAGSKLQVVNNDMGRVSRTISSLMNTNRQKYLYKPFSI